MNSSTPDYRSVCRLADCRRGDVHETGAVGCSQIESPYVSRRMLRFLVWLPPFVLLAGLWIGVLVGEHNGC